jgi:hypothetical protein
MIPILKKLLRLILAPMLLFLPTYTVFADTGPKPTMEFSFNQSSLATPVTIVLGTLYECQEADCSDAQPLMEGGPQGFRFTAESCDALAYGFAPYHRIEIEFSDGKTRQSNIFQTAGFNSMYKVIVNPDDLLVEAQPGFLAPQFSASAPRWIGGIVLLCLCALCGGVLLIALIVFVIPRATSK